MFHRQSFFMIYKLLSACKGTNIFLIEQEKSLLLAIFCAELIERPNTFGGINIERRKRQFSGRSLRSLQFRVA